MKLFIFLLIFSFNSFSQTVGYHTKELYDAITGNDTDIATNAASIVTNAGNIATNVTDLKERVQIAHYNLDASTTIAAGAVDTGLDIPAGSIITKSYFYISETIVSANDNTVAFHCESANDLYTATDLTDTATGSVIAGAITSTASDGVYSDGCNVTLTVGAGASGITAGNLDFVVEYVDL